MTMIERTLLTLTGLHIVTAVGTVVSHEDVARAIVGAMREPNEAMMHAPLAGGDCVGGFLDDHSATEVWQAMIDAILTEGENGDAPELYSTENGEIRVLRR